jgi:apolipoprotein N-acyltransferase
MRSVGAGDWRRFVTWGHAGALATGLLLAAAFPPFEDWQTAWGALVPLLLVLFRRVESWRGEGPRDAGGLSRLVRQAFRTGYFAGAVFWLVSLSWLSTLFRTSPAPAVIILAGYLGLVAYCALFMGGFAMTVTWCAARLGTDKAWKTLLLTPTTVVIGVAFEYGRGTILGGFPWNMLGVSQFRNLGLIQCAEWTGVEGVSALILLVNTGIALTILRYLPGRASRAYRPHIELFLGIATTALMFRVGMGMIRANTPPFGTLSVVAVQPAIPQDTKWSQELADSNHAMLRRLTEEAFTVAPPPDLVIWPETSTPYPVNMEGESQDLVKDLTRNGVPLLVGSMVVTGADASMECFNSSLLFDGTGKQVGRYDKQHLVPFGEYIPLSGFIPVLAQLAPMGWNCTAGKEPTILRAGDPATPFSVLICFEDIMSGLARKAVLAGARMLVNQTNDAWFDRSAGPVQHMSHCVFRAIENRVPIVRVANSGISCLIQPTGRIEGATVNSQREAPESQVCSWLVYAPPGEATPTVYMRYGDWVFAIPCAMVGGVCFVLAFAATRRKMSAPIYRGEKE